MVLIRLRCHFNLRKRKLNFLFWHYSRTLWSIAYFSRSFNYSVWLFNHFLIILSIQWRGSNYLRGFHNRNFLLLFTCTFFPLFFHIVSYLIIYLTSFLVLSGKNNFITSKNFIFCCFCSSLLFWYFSVY